MPLPPASYPIAPPVGLAQCARSLAPAAGSPFVIGATSANNLIEGNVIAGGVINGTSGTLAVKDSTVINNTAPSGADIYNLGARTLDHSTFGVIGP